MLRLCRDCQRVVIATTTKLLNTKLKAHRRRSGTYDGRLMPTPPNERQSLEQELAELPSQIAVSLRELAETPEASKDRAHREWLAWQVRNLENRLADVRARLAVMKAEGR